MRIKAPRDFWSGAIFAALGLGFAVLAVGYPMGSAMRMGPGYFPAILGGLLAVFGGLLMGRGVWLEGPPLPPLRFGALAIVVGAIVLFGVAYHWLGLVAAIIGLVMVAALAGREFKVRESLGLAVLLCALTVAVFVYLLQLPLRLWPAF